MKRFPSLRLLAMAACVAALFPWSLAAQPTPAAPERPRAFTRGSPSPHAKATQSASVREMRAIAELTRGATQALELGDVEEGRRLARLAATGLEAIEMKHRQRGDARVACRLAMQRGHILEEMVDDPVAAAEAYADAMGDDAADERAPAALHRTLERADRAGLLDSGMPGTRK